MVTDRDRQKATVMGVVQALLGPGMLLVALIVVMRRPRHGRLTWASGAIALSVGGMMGVSLMAPLLPSVLGLIVLPLAGGLVMQLRASADQPLLSPDRRIGELLNILISGVLIAFFALAPTSSSQVFWTAVSLIVVVGVELYRSR